jgi:hypothetical protein
MSSFIAYILCLAYDSIHRDENQPRQLDNAALRQHAMWKILLAPSAPGKKLTIVFRNVTSLSPFTFRSGECGSIDEVGQELAPAWPIDGHHPGRSALRGLGDAALAQLAG